jgi:hypothetical protein
MAIPIPKSYKKIIENHEYLQRKDLSDGTIVFTVKGKKGPGDFRVRAYNPQTNFRIQPKHAHFAIDFYGKLCADREAALILLKAISEIWHQAPVDDVFSKYKDVLAKLPGYKLEYILNSLKLILEQEDINYSTPRRPELQEEFNRICKKQNITTPKGREGSKITIALFCYMVDDMHPVDAFIKLGLRI